VTILKAGKVAKPVSDFTLYRRPALPA